MELTFGEDTPFISAALEKIRKRAGIIGFLLLCVMTVAATYLGITDGVERLSPAWTFNVSADIVCLMVCSILYYGCFSEKQDADESTRLFMSLLFCDATILITDMASWLLEGVSELRWLYVADYTLYLCCTVLLCYLFWRYIWAYLALDGPLPRVCNRVANLLLAPALLICLANLFVPLCFFIDKQGSFHDADASILAYAYFIVIAICSTLCLPRAKAPTRNKIVIALFYFVPFVYAIFYLDSNGAVLPDAPLLAIILMYVVLVADRSKALAATQSELDTATRIQAHMLPSTFPAFPAYREFDIYATMDPAKEVGGDFYDFFLIDSDHLALVVADVSGKGVPAALFMMTARTILKTKAQSSPTLSPQILLEEANAALCENNRDGMFVTVWLGILEISTGELTYADAGHEKLLLYQDGAWRLLPKETIGPALAMWAPEDFAFMTEEYRYRDKTIQLRPGDAIFQYTDGVTEAMPANHELFGEERLLDAMNSAPSTQPEDLLAYVRARIDEFVKGAAQFDDITMLGLQYKGRE